MLGSESATEDEVAHDALWARITELLASGCCVGASRTMTAPGGGAGECVLPLRLYGVAAARVVGGCRMLRCSNPWGKQGWCPSACLTELSKLQGSREPSWGGTRSVAAAMSSHPRLSKTVLAKSDFSMSSLGAEVLRRVAQGDWKPVALCVCFGRWRAYALHDHDHFWLDLSTFSKVVCSPRPPGRSQSSRPPRIFIVSHGIQPCEFLACTLCTLCTVLQIAARRFDLS